MADMNSTATPSRRAAGRPRSMVSEPLPTYGMAGGSLSFREGLNARERGTIDRRWRLLGAHCVNRVCFFSARAP